MGAAPAVLKALNPTAICSDCSKFVLNDCHTRSKCSECCEFEIDTEKVDLPEGESEEFIVDSCCSYRHSD